MKKPLLLLILSLAATQAHAHAQTSPLSFSQLSSPTDAPPRIQLKSLGKGWQRINIESDENDPYMMYSGMRGSMFQDALAQAGIGVYFTKGQSVKLGSETFLIAYRIDTKMTAQDMQDIFRNFGGHGNDGPVEPRKFSPNSTLLLSLLNLRTIGSLKDVRPFDAKMDVMGPVDVIEASNDNLRALGRFLVQISNQGRYGMNTSPLKNTATLRTTFNRYFHPRQGIFVHPQTKEPYRVNTTLANLPTSKIKNSARVVAIYEGTPGTDNKYGVVFLDGHVDRVPAANWKAIRAVIPQKPGFQEIQSLSASNLRQIYFKLQNFNRSRGSLPRMTSYNAMRSQLNSSQGTWNSPYFEHPATGEKYRPNDKISEKPLGKIANRSELIAVYEPTPASDNKRSAVFLDGHVARISNADWTRTINRPVKTKR